MGAALKFLSLRSLNGLAIACVALVLLLLTSKRFAQWPVDTASYRDGHGSLPAEKLPETRPPGRSPEHSSATAGRGDDPLCASFPDTSGILVVMKTGASESFARIPTQLVTMLSCLPDFFIFSDMDQNIAGYDIHDCLDAVSSEIKDSHPDFEIYRRQQWCLVDQDSCNKLGDPASEGWTLDKYKNVHIAAKSYRMRPDYSWYVFVNADSYVVWPNLVQWLAQLRSWKPLYIGSVSMINDSPFAHGGSGYILSQAAMSSFVGQHPTVANQFDERAKHECCGDYVLSNALRETTGISVEQAVRFPTCQLYFLPF